MTKLTKEQWFVGVHRIGARGRVIVPSEMVTRKVLGAAGCAEIEFEGHGCAQARVPAEWVVDIERDGGRTMDIEFGSNVWTVEISMP